MSAQNDGFTGNLQSVYYLLKRSDMADYLKDPSH